MKTIAVRKGLALFSGLLFAAIAFSSVPARWECSNCTSGGHTCTGAEVCEGFDLYECSGCDFKCGVRTGGGVTWGMNHDCSMV